MKKLLFALLVTTVTTLAAGPGYVLSTVHTNMIPLVQATNVAQAQTLLGISEAEAFESTSLRGPVRSGQPKIPWGSIVIADGVVDGEYYGFPGAVKLRNGDLYVVFRRAMEHEGYNGGTFVACRSSDGGRTWTAPEVVWEAPGTNPLEDMRDVMLTTLSDGRIAMSCYWLDPYQPEPNPPTVPYWSENTYTTGAVRYGTVADDGTITWGPNVIVVERGLGGTTPVLHGKIIELANGDLLTTAYTRGGALYTIASTDGGQTWVTRATSGPYVGYNYTESQMVQLPSGTILKIVRDSALGGIGAADMGYWLTKSTDNGATWSALEQKINTNAGAGRPEFCRLDCGALVMVTRCGVASGSGAGAFVYTSWDDGDTWIANDTALAPSGDTIGAANIMMYAALVPMSANEVGVVWATEVGVETKVWWKSIGFPPFVGNGQLAHEEANISRVNANTVVGRHTADATYTSVSAVNYRGEINATLGAERASADVEWGQLALSKTGAAGTDNTMKIRNKGGQLAVEGASTSHGLYCDWNSGTVGFLIETGGNAGINVASGKTWSAYRAGTAVMSINTTTTAFTLPPKLPNYAKASRPTLAAGDSGSMIWQTTDTPGLRVWNGTNWFTMAGTED